MNIRDIARLADVTPGTVSKVLNNYPDVGEATRQHVLKIIAENQYEPKGRGKKAEALPPRIGMVVESVYNPFYSEVEDSLSIHLHNAGYTLISFHDNFFAQNKREKFAELLTDFQPEKLNGLIYIGGNFEEVTPEEFSQLPCPTIFVNTMLPYPTGKLLYSSVQVSQFATAYAQMERLIGQGHRDICTIISSNIDTSVYSLRYRAYRAALSQNGLEKNLAAFLETDYQFDKAYGAVLAHFRAHSETTAVCSGMDIVVPAVLRALHDAGRIPGKDVNILSFDGLPALKYCIPSISTYEQPTQDIVRFVFHLIDGLINKTQNHQHITFQPLFKQRESC